MPHPGIVARWAGLALALMSFGSVQRIQHAPSTRHATKRIVRPRAPRIAVRPQPRERPSGVVSASATPTPLQLPTLTVFFVDVGQGDATILLGPWERQERRVLVIDAGPLERPDGGAVVRQLLHRERIERVDYAILTHFDADHLGGFVTTRGSTSLFWDEDCAATALFPRLAAYEHFTDTFDTPPAREWDRCIRRVPRRVRVSQATGLGDTLELGGGYSARIIAGDGYVLGRDQRVAKVGSENSRSIVTLVRGPGDFELLIPGDATGQASGAERAEVEVAIGEYLVANGIDIEVLRVGHHGAGNASNPSFIRAAKPEVAIISVGDAQPVSFKHPRCATYATLAAMNVQYVLQTEAGKPDCGQPEPKPIVAHGTIRMDVTGATYRIAAIDSPATLALAPIHLACTLSECSTDAFPDAPIACCRHCNTGQPCADSCVAKDRGCDAPRGCACAAY